MTPLSDRAPPAPKHRPPASGRVRLVEDAIIGKNARIGRNVRIINEPAATEADGEGWYIRDGIVCIPKAPSLGCHR